MQEQGAKRSDVRFTRAQVRAHTGLSDTQCRVHLDRLTELEYLLSHRGQRGQSYEYELLHDGGADSAGQHLAGLIDVDALKAMSMTASSRGVGTGLAVPTRPQNGANAGQTRSAENPATPVLARLAVESSDQMAKPRMGGAAGQILSYPKAHASLATVVSA